MRRVAREDEGLCEYRSIWLYVRNLSEVEKAKVRWGEGDRRAGTHNFIVSRMLDELVGLPVRNAVDEVPRLALVVAVVDVLKERVVVEDRLRAIKRNGVERRVSPPISGVLRVVARGGAGAVAELTVVSSK